MSKVEFRPFKMRPNKYCKWDRGLLTDFLAGLNGEEIVCHKKKRLIFCNETRDFINMCIVTDLGVGGGTTFDPKTLDEIEWIDPNGNINYKKNLVSISKKSFKGIYQSQTETFPIDHFRVLMNTLFKMYKDAQIKLSISARDDTISESKALKIAREDFKGQYFVTNEMDKCEFDKMVKEMTDVESLSYSLDSTKGGLISPELKRTRSLYSKVRFNASTSGKLSGISKFIKSLLIEKGSVKGTDKYGAEAIYYIQKKYEVIEVISETEWKRRWDKRIPEFGETLALSLMQAIMRTKKSRFMRKMDE